MNFQRIFYEFSFPDGVEKFVKPKIMIEIGHASTASHR